MTCKGRCSSLNAWCVDVSGSRLWSVCVCVSGSFSTVYHGQLECQEGVRGHKVQFCLPGSLHSHAGAEHTQVAGGWLARRPRATTAMLALCNVLVPARVCC